MIDIDGSKPLVARRTSSLDAAQFDECERIVQVNRVGFEQALVALRAIQRIGTAELQRRGYASFEDYCQRRFGWAASEVPA